MKRVVGIMLGILVVTAMLGINVLAGELPESVQKQARKDDKESADWGKFDQSGLVKFLQVEHTAASSDAEMAAKLDGSIGERLVEVKLDGSVEGEAIAWAVTNKGPGVVWVLAASDDSVTDAVEIQPEGTVELDVALEDGYAYLVVDCQGGGPTTAAIKASVGENAAKTVRGKDMAVVWF